MRSRFRRFTDGLPSWLWPSRERRVRRWLRAARKWRRKHPPRCYRCGFDLTGSRHLDTCPECGRACEWGAHWTRDGRWPIWWFWAIATTGPAAVFIAYLALHLVVRHGSFNPTATAFDWAMVAGWGIMAAFVFKFAVFNAILWLPSLRTRNQRSLGPRIASVISVYGAALFAAWVGINLLEVIFPSE